MRSQDLVICEYCDAVHARQPLPKGATARCLRCDAVLYADRPLNLDGMLALALAGLVVFAIANAYPIVEMELQRTRNSIGLWGAIVAAYDSGISFVAIVAATSLFFFPLLQMLTMLWLLIPLRAGYRPPGFARAMHALRYMRPWGMVEVFMLGVLVSVVKLASLAEVAPGPGLWAFAVLTLLMTALSSVDPEALWDYADRCA